MKKGSNSNSARQRYGSYALHFYSMRYIYYILLISLEVSFVPDKKMRTDGKRTDEQSGDYIVVKEKFIKSLISSNRTFS